MRTTALDLSEAAFLCLGFLVLGFMLEVAL